MKAKLEMYRMFTTALLVATLVSLGWIAFEASHFTVLLKASFAFSFSYFSFFKLGGNFRYIDTLFA
jgi:hypothetical protein